MPMYLYSCHVCKHPVDKLTEVHKRDWPWACPNCKGGWLIRQLTMSNFRLKGFKNGESVEDSTDGFND